MKLNSLLGVLFFASIKSHSIVLYKGADLGNGLKYWSVEDTYINARKSHKNFGRDANLLAGPNKKILIRFGDLSRAIGPYKIEKSELVLKGNFKPSQKLVSICKILNNWEEGSGSKELYYSVPLENLWNKDSNLNGTTWHQRSRDHKWMTSGASNVSDMTCIKEASLEIQKESAVIKGLNGFIQYVLQHPQHNHGLVIEFLEDVEISSSDANIIEDRPKLIVKTAPEKILLDSKVRIYDSKRITVKKIKLIVNPKIENLFDTWVKEQGYINRNAWFASCINTFNDQLMEHSRFSFVPQGLTLRLIDSQHEPDFKFEINQINDINTIGKVMKSLLTQTIKLPLQPTQKFPLKIENKDIWRSSYTQYGGIMERGDTRDERFIHNVLILQNEPWYDPIVKSTSLKPTDLLSASATIELEKLIHAPLENWKPELVMVKVCNSWGQHLLETEVTLFKNGQKLGIEKTNQQGCFNLSKEINNNLKPTDCLYLKIFYKGNESWSVLTGASVIESYARGNRYVSIVSSRFLVPETLLDKENLASGKLVSDSKKSYPAQMIRLTQENSNKSSVQSNKKGEWIELDLEKDKTIGQIILEIEGDHLPKFNIMFYGTGQKIQESILWSRENGGDWSIQNLSKPVEGKQNIKQIEYYGLPTSVRYIRFIFLENNHKFNLVNIKAYAPLIKNEP